MINPGWTVGCDRRIAQNGDVNDERSGCDSLAVAIGTIHGAYKFKGQQSLHFDRIESIQQQLPGFPLVLHGSSSVPQEEVERINAAGQ